MIAKLLAALPGWAKWALLTLAALAVWAVLYFTVNAIYQAGYGKAQAEGKAALAALEQKHAEENAARWAEYATKEREARERLQDEQAKANTLEAALLETKNTLAAERRGFAKRIADATRNSDCILTAEFVRLYNEALYGPAGAGNQNSAGSAAGPAQGAPAPAPLGAGLLREQPVTLKDLLAHAKLYGEWAREVHAIALGWVTLSKDW